MDISSLEELLSDILPTNFKINKSKTGEIVINTGLKQSADGELVDLKDFDDEEESSYEDDYDSLDDDGFLD